MTKSDNGKARSQAAAEGVSEGRLSSVSAAIQLLKTFSEDEPEIGISALAKKLSLAKSTVHRLASTLLADGLLEQNAENGKYRLGIELFTLGALVRRRMDISKSALPFLHELRESLDETVHLAILDRTNIVYLYFLESNQAIRMRSYMGSRKPAYCTSEGLVMLAYSQPDVVGRVINEGLVPRTPKTQTDPAALLKTLAQIRVEGYAIDDEGSEVGMRVIAAPVRDMTNNVVAAISVGGPMQRLTKKSLKGLAPQLMETAERLSETLGYRR